VRIRLSLCVVLISGGACATSHSSPAGGDGGRAGGAAGLDAASGAAGTDAVGAAGAAGGGGAAGAVDAAGGAPGPRDAGVEAGTFEVAPETMPPTPIDFSIWQLQLPTGSGTSPTTVSPAELAAGFSNAYFYRAPGGGQVFMDPATGVTTSGSVHCRTELREMTRDGKPAMWPSTGTNTLRVSAKIVQVGGGAGGQVTVAQVFNGTDAIPLGELEYSTKLGGFQLLYEEGKGAGTTTDLKAPVALGAPTTFVLDLSQGALTVSVDGKAVYARTPSVAVAAKSFYFKAGNYDQTAAAGPISTTPYTVVEVDALDVTHR
jgi:hypothetical protein